MSYGFMSKKAFIVPYWVMEVLLRYKLTPSSLADYDKLKSILSAKDLAAISIMTYTLLPDLLNTNTEYLSQHSMTNAVDLPWSNKAMEDSTFKLLISSDTMVEEVKERIYSADVSNYIYEQGVCYDNAFDVLDVNRDYVAVVIKPDFFKEPGGNQYNINEANSLSLALTKAVIRVFNLYYKPHDVASTLWFTNYLRLLSLRSL